MMTIKLSSTNYLIWRNNILPIFTYQKLLPHLNGTSTTPPAIITVAEKEAPNPAAVEWAKSDQRAVILLQSSLTEEAATEVLGLHTAREIWVALENSYNNASVERIHSLRDSLRQLTKGTSSVSDFSRRFKSLVINCLLLVIRWMKSIGFIGFYVVWVRHMKRSPQPFAL